MNRFTYEVTWYDRIGSLNRNFVTADTAQNAVNQVRNSFYSDVFEVIRVSKIIKNWK